MSSLNAEIYEQQQGLKLIPNNANCDSDSGREDLSTIDVFETRIAATIRGMRKGATQNVPSIYPGAVVPSPGGTNDFTNRGILYKDQYDYYCRLGWFQNHRVNLSIKSIPPTSSWNWNHVARPLLALVEARPEPNHVATSRTTQPPLAIPHKLQASNIMEQAVAVQDILNEIHAIWCTEPCYTQYSESAIATSSRWLQQLGSRSEARDDVLHELFEIEAGATFLTQQPTEKTVMFRGMFESNWILVHQRPLTSLIQSELCETQRIFDELLRLGERRFAPIVVNEYNAVSDGNHRLTSAWIWNLLHYCKDVVWSLDSEQLQTRIAMAVVQLHLDAHPVTLHEALQHLHNILSEPQRAKEFEAKVRPLLNQHRAIELVPTVFVPEYLCCAVDKARFDTGQMMRAEPRLYRAISENRHLTLPPRAHYHYTDSILLPWFRVV